MISYYNSKHPGLFIYIFLVSISVLLCLFIDINAVHIGALSILWGIFIFMRILSLYEVGEYFAAFTKMKPPSKNSNSSVLAHDLLRRMNGKNHMKRGALALHSMDGRTLLWFALAIAYVGYNFYLSQNVFSIDIFIQNTSIFFMIGAGFWAGQTYAYSSHASRLLTFVFAILFGITLFKMWGVIGSNIPEITALFNLAMIGENSFSVLAVLMAYCIAMLLYSLLKGSSYSVNALIGLVVVAILSVFGIILEANPDVTGYHITALWLSGWSLFSIFWMRSHCITRKRYVLYQCE